jgi:hypothetical protein
LRLLQDKDIIWRVLGSKPTLIGTLAAAIDVSNDYFGVFLLFWRLGGSGVSITKKFHGSFMGIHGW